jgi:Flp pilus assembly protein TadD
MQLANSQLDSIQRYEQYARIDPQNTSLQLQLGDLYHQAGRFDEALACYNRCLALKPNDPQAQSRAASVMISQHQFAEAEKLLAPLTAADTDPALQHNLGLTIYFQHRFEEARNHFQTAANRGLIAPSNFAYLARSLHHLGEMESAIAAGKKWVEVEHNVKSTSYLALLHIDGGDVHEAHRLGLEVLQQDPENVDANVAVGSATMEQQQSERARECFQTAIRHDPDNGRAWLGMGLVHLYDQETSQAIDALSKAAQVFPENAGIAVTLAWSYVINHDANGAEKFFLKAIEVDHNFAEAHAGYAAALAMQGKLEPARAALELARRLDRKSFGAVLAESFLQATEGNQEASAAAFNQLLSQRPRQDMLPLIEQLRIYSGKHRLRPNKQRH